MHPIFWIGLLVGGGYAASKTGEAMEGSAKLVKWGAAAGTVYVSYQALKAAGAIK